MLIYVLHGKDFIRGESNGYQPFHIRKQEPNIVGKLITEWLCPAVCSKQSINI
jgi:hypothetical protein